MLDQYNRLIPIREMILQDTSTNKLMKICNLVSKRGRRKMRIHMQLQNKYDVSPIKLLLSDLLIIKSILGKEVEGPEAGRMTGRQTMCAAACGTEI